MRISALLISIGLAFSGMASHIAGAYISWRCLGSGQYEIELNVFRDCSGQTNFSSIQDVRVWNHPTRSSVQCNLSSVTDISPDCTPAGGATMLQCAQGDAGTMERLIFLSDPITLAGVPPSDGWIFSWEDGTRNGAIDNLLNPVNEAITVWAKMYPFQGQDASNCYDSAPTMGQNFVSVVCAGDNVKFDPGFYDVDADSLVFEWGHPLGGLFGASFNPPVDPMELGYVSGFSPSNPTPDASFNTGNIPATLDGQDGTISFLSNTVGNYVLATVIKAYRGGQIISETLTDLQLVIIPCPGYNNNAPVVTPPFAGGTSWDTTVLAGDLVSFDLVAVDNENLQDGSPQTNILTPSGAQFGLGFTLPSGCANPPCATLSNGPFPTAGVQGVTSTFDWQTDCNHLISGGVSNTSVAYNFVFRVDDNYCSVPRSTFATVTINVVSQNVLQAPPIHCAEVMPNGDVLLTWTPISDPLGSFSSYDIYDGSGNWIATLPNITTGSYLVPGAGADAVSQSYYLAVSSGCGGLIQTYSDTIQTMLLDLGNDNEKRAILQWNQPYTTLPSGYHDWVYIEREYPTGTWTVVDSVPYGETYAVDTIDVCGDSLSYRVRMDHESGCSSYSSIERDYFKDKIQPIIPVIEMVTVDTASGLSTIEWDVNLHEDVIGYVIFQDAGGGFWNIIDTVWGRTNVTYTYPFSTPGQGAETYAVAAFDSCASATDPNSNNISAKSNAHTTIFLSGAADICSRAIDVIWTHYQGWNAGHENYVVTWGEVGMPHVDSAVLSPAKLSYRITGLERGKVYSVVVRTKENGDTTISLSNLILINLPDPSAPAYQYITKADVKPNDDVELNIIYPSGVPLTGFVIERSRANYNDFSEVGESVIGPGISYFMDQDARPDRYSYEYRAIAMDSCGELADTTNWMSTVHLQVQVDQHTHINRLNWNAPQGWDGAVVEYHLFRATDGAFGVTPLAILPATQRYYEDDVSTFLDERGEFCYRILAVESNNAYGTGESQHSNIVCAVIEPLVYVPNAMIVGGYNDIFNPVLSFDDPTGFDMKIFDRWGEVIFHTDVDTQGWDGRLKNGEFAKEGVYVYLIQVKDGAGKTYDFRGSVTLLNATE